jgi:hypothetical protein
MQTRKFMLPNMLFEFFPFSVHPFATMNMKEAESDCLLLVHFAAFCFIHGGSWPPFLPKQTSISPEAVHVWYRHAVDENRCPYLFGSRFTGFWKQISMYLKHIVISTSEYILLWQQNLFYLKQIYSWWK